MKNLFSRRGRLNSVSFGNGNTIQKIGVIVEGERPHRLAVEAWALSQARKNGVCVPEVLDYHKNEEGQEVLTLERISGQNLEEINDEISRKQCVFQISEQLKLFNGISSGYGWITPPSFAVFILLGAHFCSRTFISMLVKSLKHACSAMMFFKSYRNIRHCQFRISKSFIITS